MRRTLIATIIGPNKRYTRDMVLREWGSLPSNDFFVVFVDRGITVPPGTVTRYLPPLPGESEVHSKARARQLCFDYFIKRPIYQQLYFHDPDMIVPAGSLEELDRVMARERADMAVPGYYIRGHNGPILHALHPFDIPGEVPSGFVGDCSLGAALISRKLVQSCPFLYGDKLTYPESAGDGYGWTATVSAAGFKIWYESGISVSHLGADGVPAERWEPPLPEPEPDEEKKGRRRGGQRATEEDRASGEEGTGIDADPAARPKISSDAHGDGDRAGGGGDPQGGQHVQTVLP